LKVCGAPSKSVASLGVTEKVFGRIAEQIRIALVLFRHGDGLIGVGYLTEPLGFR
jgi:hypothetical protein